MTPALEASATAALRTGPAKQPCHLDVAADIAEPLAESFRVGVPRNQGVRHARTREKDRWGAGGKHWERGCMQQRQRRRS